MTREELKGQMDELMQQYANEEIDGPTYAERMMALTTSAQTEIDEDYDGSITQLHDTHCHVLIYKPSNTVLFLLGSTVYFFHKIITQDSFRMYNLVFSGVFWRNLSSSKMALKIRNNCYLQKCIQCKGFIV